ncbi:MAG: 23S rRNA (pseudouridine(1915)-N(3))-methyltransferase RlmH [Proteobacteria bacterium]|jgi:23S rRNA (pseudouridine1915-N3)-methyltransferase|nr:23S rRNA (pseudouridine(1915)-N(3))-methyltransferase RlmH [Alphaproteobacteria bacterium]NCC03280.1 23S rRNA (pseudouridine(1915)-N(3))-methyltransferase RlmH [Pseudomonadota bacterium]
MKITVFAVGKAKGEIETLCGEYAKRIKLPFAVREFSGASNKAEGQAILSALPSKACLVLMDERGKDLSSRELAQKIENWQGQGTQELVFAIGGADGVSAEVRARADFVLGLGRKTWPHMLARLMLIEQIYRALTIIEGHPYHRD